MKKLIASTLTLLLLLTSAGTTAFARDNNEEPQGTIEIRGIVKDEQNAFIVAAPVILTDAQGQKVKETVSDDRGQYRLTGLRPGTYTLTVEVEGFGKFTQEITLATQRVLEFDVPLKVMISDVVDVKNDSSRISTDPDSNLTATTLGEKELEALPDDPDEMLEVLKQMAGASGGGDAARVYVNGFTEGGRIPPKEAILSVRLNSNPFSAEFSEPGFSRIEIITKPGASRTRGSFNFRFNDEALNARHSKALFKAPTQSRNYNGNITGPIIKNRWGYFFDIDRNENDENAFINAIVLDPVTLLPTPFVDTILTPNRRFNFSVRTDYLLNNRNTLGIQYRHGRSDSENQGLGDFSLPERASTSFSRDHTLRVSLTSIASEHAVNEFRMQLNRRTFGSQAVNEGVAINVADAFYGGGNQGSLFSDNTNDGLEFVNNLTYTHNKHTFKFGFRADGTRLDNLSRSNFGGTFTFGTDFERDAQGSAVLEDGVPVPISGLELYRRVLLGVPGYRPSQFMINRGDPALGLNQWEMGYFAQDDWRISPTLTLSYGFRHDFQTHLNDKINIAPRVGLAWNPDKARKSTIRAGAGIFYNYIGTNVTLDTLRYNGTRQENLIITRPNFFETIPDDFTGALSQRQAIRTKSEGLNAPYNVIGTVAYERQLPWQMSGTVSYTYNKGLHLLRLRNINAPTDPANPIASKPIPDQGAIFEHESTGVSVRNQVTFSLSKAFTRTFSMFGFYTLAKTNSDVDGSPSNPYNLDIDYGRSSNDVRHSLVIVGSFTLPWNVRLGSHFNYSSSRPFNITTGRDNNLDTVFSDRPAFAEIGDPGAIVTPFGVFNPNPRPGDTIIPRNFGIGPSRFMASMNISKTFGFGGPAGGFPGMSANAPGGNNQQQGDRGNNQGNNQNNRGGNRGGQGGNQGGGQRGGGEGMMMRGGMGGGPRGGGGGGGPMMMGGGGFGGTQSRYNLTLGVNINNLFNTTNFGNYNGTLTSPLFGISNSAMGARRIEASLRFSF